MDDKVLRILSEIRPEFDFQLSANFIEQGMLDSFDVFNLVVSLDNEFGISIDGVDIKAENFSSLEKIVDLVKRNGAI
jgi:acyl carrier protein